EKNDEKLGPENFNDKDFEYAILRFVKKKLKDKKISDFENLDFKKMVLYAYIAKTNLIVDSEILNYKSKFRVFDAELAEIKNKFKSKDDVLLTIVFLYEKNVISKKNFATLIVSYIIEIKDVKSLRNIIKIAKNKECFDLVSKIYVEKEVNPLIGLVKSAYTKRKNKEACQLVLLNINQNIFNLKISEIVSNAALDARKGLVDKIDKFKFFSNTALSTCKDTIPIEKREKYFLLIPDETKKTILSYISRIIESYECLDSNSSIIKYANEIYNVLKGAFKISKIRNSNKYDGYNTIRLPNIGDPEKPSVPDENLKKELHKNRIYGIIKFFIKYEENDFELIKNTCDVTKCKKYVAVFDILSKEFEKEENLEKTFNLLKSVQKSKISLNIFMEIIDDYSYQIENVNTIINKVDKNEDIFQKLFKDVQDYVSFHNYRSIRIQDRFEVFLKNFKAIIPYDENIMNLYKILRKNSFDDYELSEFNNLVNQFITIFEEIKRNSDNILNILKENKNKKTSNSNLKTQISEPKEIIDKNIIKMKEIVQGNRVFACLADALTKKIKKDLKSVSFKTMFNVFLCI
ncbi:MAG: hypothetical protein FWC41_13365, partial [Firmicutes bacterium]|nr:hypothetical protein [Bacillota bacterium]